MKAKLGLAVALTCLILSPATRALVVYDADAMSTFTLLDPGGLGITFDIGIEPTPTMTTGTGIASIDADAHTPPAPTSFAPAIGESVTIMSAVSGSADAPGGGSTASVFNGFTVTLVNPGPGPLTALFAFSYEWFVDVAKSDLPREAASASSFFHLSGFAPSGTETLAIDELMGGGPVAVADWLVHPEILSPFGLGGSTLSGSATVHALVTVPGMATDIFSVITDATGSAVHVSAPASLWLVLLAGAWIGGRRAIA